MSTIEEVYIDENKDAALSAMEEYFSKDGEIRENVQALFEAIIKGQIPLLGLKY